MLQTRSPAWIVPFPSALAVETGTASRRASTVPKASSPRTTRLRILTPESRPYPKVTVVRGHHARRKHVPASLRSPHRCSDLGRVAHTCAAVRLGDRRHQAVHHPAEPGLDHVVHLRRALRSHLDPPPRLRIPVLRGL